MTKEQEEAISTMQHWIDYEKRNKDKIQKADELINIQETVLSMLKEQQEENKKKDKIIDLMTEIFYKRFRAELLLEYGFESEEQLKQYFKKKVEQQ